MGNSSLGCSLDEEAQYELRRSTLSCSEQALPAFVARNTPLGDGRSCWAEESERELRATVHIPDRFMEAEAAAPSYKGPQRKALPDMKLTARIATCDGTEGLCLWEEATNDPDSVESDGEHILEEVTYRLHEDAARVQHYSETDIDVSSVETWASMNFNRRKAGLQLMNGLTQQDGGSVGADSISTRESDSLGLCCEPVAATMAIRAISPPPHALTPVGVPAAFDRKAPAQAQVDLPDVS